MVLSSPMVIFVGIQICITEELARGPIAVRLSSVPLFTSQTRTRSCEECTYTDLVEHTLAIMVLPQVRVRGGELWEFLASVPFSLVDILAPPSFDGPYTRAHLSRESWFLMKKLTLEAPIFRVNGEPSNLQNTSLCKQTGVLSASNECPWQAVISSQKSLRSYHLDNIKASLPDHI